MNLTDPRPHEGHVHTFSQSRPYGQNRGDHTQRIAEMGMEQGEGQFYCPICGIKDSEEMGKPCIHCQRNEDMEAAGAGMFDEQAAVPSSAFDPIPQQDDLSAPPTKQGHSTYTDAFGNEMEYTGSFRGDPVDSRDWLMDESSPVDVDPELMAKFAGKDFSPREQREFIDEEGKGGPARNLHKLDLSGTHYEAEGDFGDSFF